MKGISPMIAVVLIIAFTVAVGGIISVWLTSLTTTQTTATSTEAEKQIKCAGTVLELSEVTSDLTNANWDLVNITVKYTYGTEDLYYFNITLTDASRTSMTITPRAGYNYNASYTFKPGELKVWNLNTSNTDDAIDATVLIASGGGGLSGSLQEARVLAKCQTTYPIFGECESGEPCMV